MRCRSGDRPPIKIAREKLIAMLLSLPAAALVITGLVTLMRGPIPLGVVLVLVGQGEVSVLASRWPEESGDRDEQ